MQLCRGEDNQEFAAVWFSCKRKLCVSLAPQFSHSSQVVWGDTVAKYEGGLVIHSSCFIYAFFRCPHNPHCFVPRQMKWFFFYSLHFVSWSTLKNYFIPVRLLTDAFWCFPTLHFQGTLKENFTKEVKVICRRKRELLSSWDLLTGIWSPLLN